MFRTSARPLCCLLHRLVLCEVLSQCVDFFSVMLCHRCNCSVLGFFFACCCFSSSFSDLFLSFRPISERHSLVSAHILTSSSFFLGMKFQHLQFFLDGADLCCLVVFGQRLRWFCCNADASLFYTHTKARKFPCAGSQSSPAALGNTSLETTTI